MGESANSYVVIFYDISHTYTHARTHTHTHTDTYMHAYIYINIYIYIYIPVDKNIRRPSKMKKEILFTILKL